MNSNDQWKPILAIRQAFTLIELLIVISIIVVFSSLALVVLRSAQDDARAARSASIVGQCRVILQNKLDSFETRPMPFNFKSFPMAPNEPEWMHRQKIRKRTLMEWVLAEMPSHIEEVELFPSYQSRQASTAPLNSVDYWPIAWADHYRITALGRPTSGLIAARRVLNTSLVSGSYMPNDGNMPPNGFSDDDNCRDSDLPGPLPPKELYPLRYNPSLPGINKPLNGQVNNPASGNPYTLFDHSVIEGSECLYAILYNTWDNENRGTHFLNGNEIGDLDGDNRPEVLDAWGEPLYFTITLRAVDDNGNLIDRNQDLATDYLDLQLDPNYPAELFEYQITITSIRGQNQ